MVFTHLNPGTNDHGINGRLFQRLVEKWGRVCYCLWLKSWFESWEGQLITPPLFYTVQGWSTNPCIGPEAGHTGWWGPIHLEVGLLKKVCSYYLLINSPFLIKYPLKISFIIVKICSNPVICGSASPDLTLTQLDIGKFLFKFQ